MKDRPRNARIQIDPAQFLRRPLAIWPAEVRDGKAYSFGIARTDGHSLTVEEYTLIRAALGMTTLSREEVLAIFTAQAPMTSVEQEPTPS